MSGKQTTLSLSTIVLGLSLLSGPALAQPTGFGLQDSRDECWVDARRVTCLPPIDRSWHLLTQSYGGTVSLLRDLTKRECESIHGKLTEKIALALSLRQCKLEYGSMCTIRGDLLAAMGDGDIKTAECFQ